MKRIKVLLIVTIICSLYSCDDDFVTKTNPNTPSSDAYIFTKDDAFKAVVASYAKLQSAGLYANKYPGLLASKSDLFIGTNGKQHYADIPTFTRTASETSNNETTYRNIYQGVWRCNQVIERVGPLDLGISEYVDQNGNAITVQDLFVAEAKFLKGLYYFIGLNYFGKIIPIDKLPQSQDDFNNPFLENKPGAYTYIEGLFKEAAATLPVNHAQGRANRGASMAYLGKLYLYWTSIDKSKYDLAITAFEEVLQPQYGYALVTDWMDNFTEVNQYNSESIFEVAFLVTDEALGNNWGPDDDDNPKRDENNSQEMIFGPLRGHIAEDSKPHAGWHEGYPSTKLMNEFEDGDPRKEMGIFAPGDVLWQDYTVAMLNESEPGNPQNYVFGKWIRASANNHASLRDSEINRRILRLADVYLMYAECLMKVSRTAEAVEQINKVRERVGMPALSTGLNVDEVYLAIKHERAVELFFEGTRFYDMMRWANDPSAPFDAIAEIQQVHPLFTENKHELAPIPQSEIDSNPLVTSSDQNPGY